MWLLWSSIFSSKTFPRLRSIPIPEDINEVVDGLTSATVDQGTTSTGTCSKLGLNIAVEEVKDRLGSLALTVSTNSFGRLRHHDLMKEWTGLLNFAAISL